MPEVGRLAVCLALLFAAYGVLAGVAGGLRRRAHLVRSAEHAAYAVFGLVVIATAILLRALLRHDFTLEYVAAYSSSTLPTQYTIAALWGGQKGSLLFWSLLLTLFTTIVQVQNRERNRALMPYVTATLMTVAVFFLSLLVFVTDPFERLPVAAREGADLNPLLQNYWMMIHPPSLYTGYVSASVPFAFGAAALITGRLDDAWIRTTRRWAIFSWFFLTLGNMFGARWAYEVLGWGGYWAWDPGENAAFMPWLVMTAYLHSVMIQERKDMLKVWNLALIAMAFGLTLFGTFITRSGVISSVHSFTQSGLGPYFLSFLITAAVLYTGLLLFRVKSLRTPAEFESYLSREAAFLFNNLVLVGIAFAVFWGTLFPVLSEAVRGVKITVGPLFFDKVNAPLALALVFLMGVGPLIAWRRSSLDTVAKTFAAPVIFGVVTGICAFIAGLREWYVLTALSLGAFALGTVFVEFRRGVSARRHMVSENPARAIVNLVAKNNRRYGGYIIHIGVVMAFVGIVASSFFKTEVKKSLKQGESFQVGSYELEFLGLSQNETSHLETISARLELLRDGKPIVLMQPAKLFYKRPQQPATSVAIRSTPAADLYVVLAGIDDATGLTTFQVFLTPLVFWLWAGGLIMALGTVVAMWPNVRERAAIAAAVRLPATVDIGVETVPGGD